MLKAANLQQCMGTAESSPMCWEMSGPIVGSGQSDRRREEGQGDLEEQRW